MAQALAKTVACLRQLAARPAPSERSDRQLLEAFAAAGDEAAFTQLVRRHGEMVQGVCRRVLGHADDADDAFQATFLVLARKAGRGGWHDSVRNWLFGVAYRIARKARAMQARRRHKESQAGQAAAATALESAWTELRGVLDEELHNLPAKYRAPLLLCYLDGKTREEAAMLLRWSVGSVKGRLERGRELLRERLRSRGLTLPAVLCAGLLAQTSVSAALVDAAAHAAVPFAAGNVAAATSPLALQLAQGALQAMLIAKCKITGVVVTLTCALGLGGTLAVHQVWAERPAAAAAAPWESLDLAVLDPAPIAYQEQEGGRREAKEQERGRGDEKERGKTVPGIFKSADVKVGTITVRMARDGERGEKTFNLAGKDVKVTGNTDKPVALGELREGTLLMLSLNDNNDVTAIHVNRARETPRRPAPGREDPRREGAGRVGGVIVEIDAAKGAIGLLIGREGDLSIKTLTLAKDAKVRLMHGERPHGELTVAQLTKAVQAWVTLADDQKSVTALDVAAPVVRLRVKSVDVAARKIVAAADRTAEQTFELAPDAKVVRGRTEVQLGELMPGTAVLLTLSLDRSKVIAATVIGDAERGR